MMEYPENYHYIVHKLGQMPYWVEGSAGCFFCGGDGEHFEDCIWKMANDLVNE